MRTLVAMLAAVPLVLAGSPAAAGHPAVWQRQTTFLSVSDLTFSPSVGGVQTIHIEGENTAQPITVNAGPYHQKPTREGGSCTSLGTPTYKCTGTGAVTIPYGLNPVPSHFGSHHGIPHAATASTDDGASATGYVTARWRTDVAITHVSHAVIGDSARIQIRFSSSGPDPALDAAIRIHGIGQILGTDSLYVCGDNGVDATCHLGTDPFPPLFAVYIPRCSIYKPITVSISARSDDPNGANNAISLAAYEPRDPTCGGSGGSGGGGAGGGVGPGGGAADTVAAAASDPAQASGAAPPSGPSPTGSTSPQATSTPDRAAVVDAALSTNDTGRSWSWWLAQSTAATLVAISVVGLAWWRRRSAAPMAGSDHATD
jgi:hypothetical protein